MIFRGCGSDFSGFDLDVVGESVCNNEDAVESMRF